MLVVERLRDFALGVHRDGASSSTSSTSSTSSEFEQPQGVDPLPAHAGRYRVTLANSGAGIHQHHPSDMSRYPKTRFRCALHLGEVEGWRIVDEATVLHISRINLQWLDAHGPSALYQFLLPHFMGPHQLPDAQVAELEVEGRHGDWETPQRSGTCYFRCNLTSVRYLLRRRYGWEREAMKRFMCAVRLAFLQRARAHVGSVREVIRPGGAAWPPSAKGLLWQRRGPRAPGMTRQPLGALL